MRDAALVLLYRLLFILYAEDRDLLPVHERRYDDYGLRERVRLDVGRRMDAGDTISTTAARYWSVLDDLCRAIDNGDADIGLPPYNGGLFDKDRTPLLTEIRLGDALIANVIDKLSFIKSEQGRRYINYRDLSVQQLGSIYERLLEHEIVRDDGDVRIRPNILARKASGSYYTCVYRKPKPGRNGDAVRRGSRATRYSRSAEWGERPAHLCPVTGAF